MVGVWGDILDFVVTVVTAVMFYLVLKIELTAGMITPIRGASGTLSNVGARRELPDTTHSTVRL